MSELNLEQLRAVLGDVVKAVAEVQLALDRGTIRIPKTSVPDDCDCWSLPPAEHLPFCPARTSRKATEVEAAKAAVDTNRCNRHADCDAADRRARELGRFSAEHCHDGCCEECFGS